MSGAGNGRGDTRPTENASESLPDEVAEGVVRYIPELRAFARSLTLNRAWADDLSQEAISRALAAAHQFKPGTNFKAWIFTILRNCYFNEHRKEQNRKRYHTDLAISGQTRLPAQQERYLEMCEVRRAFEQLRPHQREALMLVGPSGLSYEEAAKTIGCQLGTMKSRVSRARRDLLKILEAPPSRSRKDLPPITGRSSEKLHRIPGWELEGHAFAAAALSGYDRSPPRRTKVTN